MGILTCLPYGRNERARRLRICYQDAERIEASASSKVPKLGSLYNLADGNADKEAA